MRHADSAKKNTFSVIKSTRNPTIKPFVARKELFFFAAFIFFSFILYSSLQKNPLLLFVQRARLLVATLLFVRGLPQHVFD